MVYRQGRGETRAMAGSRGWVLGTLPPAGDPAAPSEMLKRHNANSLALWPLHRCHGAAAENKHNSPHVFSAPSTPWPLPCRVCPSGSMARSHMGQGIQNRAGLLLASPGEGQQWQHTGSPTVPVEGRTPKPGGEWRGDGGLDRDSAREELHQGCSQTTSPREVSHPITCIAAGQGRAREEQEPSHNTVARSPSCMETATRG